MVFGSSPDGKPETFANNTLLFEIDTGNIHKFVSGSWTLFAGAAKQEVLANKTIDISTGSNIITGLTDASIASNASISKSKLAPLSIVDADIASGAAITSAKLAQITDKTKLPSDILYTGDSVTLTNKTLNTINNTLMNLGIYQYSIFIYNSICYLRNNLTGTIDSFSNTAPETVFQYALSHGGGCYVHGGTYTFSASFAGLDFPQEPLSTYFHMGVNCILVVPNAYASYVFRMVNSSTNHCSNNVLQGGVIQEAGTIQRNWIGVRMQGTGANSKGVFHNTVRNVKMNYPAIGVHLYEDSTGTTTFVNDNFFYENLIYQAKTAYFDFDMQVAWTDGFNGFYRDRFERNTLQATNTTDPSVGFRNIRHKDMSFINNYCADFGGSQATATIHPDASHTRIEGGTLTALNFVDNSTSQSTKIIDENKYFQIGRITPGQSGTNLDIVPTGTTNTFSWWDSAKSRRLYIQKGTDNNIHLNAVKQSGGSIPALIFEQQDVSISYFSEIFRIDSDSKIKIKNSKLYIRDSDESHGYTITPGNITADYNLSIPVITANSTLILDTTLASTLAADKSLLPSDVLTGRQTNNGKKWGLNQCVHGGTAVWDGILGSASTASGGDAPIGMTSGQLVTADGRFVRWQTKTSTPAALDKGGWRIAAAITCRAWNPTFFCRFRLNQTADTRLWLGITGDLAADPTGDDALNAKSGVMFGIGVVNNTVGTGSTVGWQLMHNDGTGATVSDTVGPAADTNIHTIEIKAVDASSKFQYSLDGGAFVDVTTDIPAPATALSFIAELQTSAAAQKTMDLFDIHVTSDK